MYEIFRIQILLRKVLMKGILLVNILNWLFLKYKDKNPAVGGILRNISGQASKMSVKIMAKAREAKE